MPSNRHVSLLFTLDYEVFGDGSGSTCREQCIPTSYLADVLELHDLRMTIFAEVGQQIYFRAHGLFDQYHPVEEQLIALSKRGHDVQLHIHPMWFFAPAPIDGQIDLSGLPFDLSCLPPRDIERIVSESTAYLRDLLSPHIPGFTPTAYRAGAWSMKRANVLFPILRKNGILIDSTVAPGARFDAEYGSFDYSKVEMEPIWRDGALLELPILTSSSLFGVFSHLNQNGLDTRKIVGQFYPLPVASRGRSILKRLLDIVGRRHLLADFNTLSVGRLAKMIVAQADRWGSEAEPVPIVLIGHSKSTYFADRIHLLVADLAGRGVRLHRHSMGDFLTRCPA